MLLQKWGGCTGLPSQYRPSKQSFQHGSEEMEASGLPSKDTESSSKNLTASQTFSAAELERSSTNRTHSPEVLFPAKFLVKGTPQVSLDLCSSRSPLRGYNRESLFPGHPPRGKSMHLQQGTHSSNMGLTNGAEYGRQHPNSLALRRRHSLSPLPNCDTREHNPTQPMAERVWNGSALDLRASLLEERQRESDLGEERRVPQGQSQEHRERNLELELNLMQFELISLKQKMESSFAHLEKEKKWLEVNCSEGRKQKGDLDDKIFSSGMQPELTQAKSYFGKRNPGLPCLDSSQMAAAETKDRSQELAALQDSLAAQKQHLKALQGTRDEMAQWLRSARKGQETGLSQTSEAKERVTDSLQANQVLREERGRLQAAYNSISLEKDRLEEKVNELSLKLTPALAERERLLQEKVSLHQQVQNLILELGCAQKKQEGSNDQVSALRLKLASAKTQVNHLDKEKVLMKEELESVRQANKELSSEVAESRQRLEASLEELHHLEAEKKILDHHIQALEDERTQLLAEKEERPLQRQEDVRNQEEEEEEMKALREHCENLKESQALLQREKDLLQTRCLDLKEALHRKQEEMGNQLAEQQQISQDWQDRWEQLTAALKTKEEELENAAQRSPDHSAKVEVPLLLQVQLDACKQELELERNRSHALRHQVQMLQPWSQSKAASTNETSLKGMDTEPALVQEQLQKVWATRRTCDVELADKPLAPASSRSQGQQEQLSLKRQHHLVTEQLKDLFRQRRQQEAGARVHPEERKEKSAVAPCKPAGMPAAVEGAQPGSPADPSSDREAQSLRQQLKENTETISCMASEIQALRQKNETLMEAKLRFRQQIQEIRRVSKQQPERSSPEMLVPRFSVGWRQDLQSDSSEPSPQSDESVSSLRGGENQGVVLQDIQLHAGMEDKRSHVSSAAGATALVWPAKPAASPLPLHLDLTDIGAATSPRDPWRSAEGEGALLGPQGSGLLSPRPFGPQRPWSPFKFKGSPEPSEN